MGSTLERDVAKEPKDRPYFERFEMRQPPPPVPYSMVRELLWQFLATVALGLGVRYMVWRWVASLNFDALWFSLPVLIAETLSFIGLFFFVANLWKTEDYEPKDPPRLMSDCVQEKGAEPRPIRVDIFFPTYNEDPELVRLSIQDARKLTYPHPIETRIHVLDDGNRAEMKGVAMEERVNYITRPNNVGYKAGNLRNGMEHTSGDFLLICDADTRPFPGFLEHTLGYFRDPDVAWVQTPQWFFDIPDGKRLPKVLSRYLGSIGAGIGTLVEWIVGPIYVGRDIFGSDPMLFYDAILRRRNWANASFCCGAGSLHRREAVMQAALRSYSEGIDKTVQKITGEVKHAEFRAALSDAMSRELALETEVTPYKFHVSEDIYTSMVLHSDRSRRWKSVYHPVVESKMLSPQDLLTVLIQRFKYAGGTLDITFNDNPLFRKGMRWPQKLMYGATMWGYLSCLWIPVFLAAPIIYFFTEIAPISAYSPEFYNHVLPFLFFSELAMMVGLWGLPNWRGRSLFLSMFPVNLRAFVTVLRGEKSGFKVTPKMRQEGNFAGLVQWQIGAIVLTVAGIAYSGVRLWLGYSDNLSGWLVNTFWSLNNIIALSGVISAAFWKPDAEMMKEASAI